MSQSRRNAGRGHRPARPRGFSIIELLTVMFIIMFLLGFMAVIDLKDQVSQAFNLWAQEGMAHFSAPPAVRTKPPFHLSWFSHSFG